MQSYRLREFFQNVPFDPYDSFIKRNQIQWDSHNISSINLVFKKLLLCSHNQSEKEIYLLLIKMERKREKVCHEYIVNHSLAKKIKADQDFECKLSKSKPGLLQNVFENSDICEKIFLLLDDNDLRACRLVCHSWKAQVDYPYFKIKLSKQIGISEELRDTWIELIKYGKLPLCKKWHGKYWTPLHVAAPDPNGWTPLQRAAQYGSTETFKFLAPQV